jgi:hypothetical protein
MFMNKKKGISIKKAPLVDGSNKDMSYIFIFYLDKTLTCLISRSKRICQRRQSYTGLYKIVKRDIAVAYIIIKEKE